MLQLFEDMKFEAKEELHNSNKSTNDSSVAFVLPTVVTYNILLNALGREGMLGEMLSTLEEMKSVEDGKKVVEPDAVTYITMINAFEELGETDLADAMWTTQGVREIIEANQGKNGIGGYSTRSLVFQRPAKKKKANGDSVRARDGGMPAINLKNLSVNVCRVILRNSLHKVQFSEKFVSIIVGRGKAGKRVLPYQLSEYLTGVLGKQCYVDPKQIERLIVKL
jgi:pentatricopeptide repeat protein